jgi:hypothetical protein
MRKLTASAVLLAAMVLAGEKLLEAQSTARPNTRQGFWIGLGLGTGSAGLDCTSCSDDRVGGLSGNVRLGGSVSPSVLLGGETNGWSHSESGLDEVLGFASFVALWYPSRAGAFYLKFGLGGMSYKADDGVDELTATAPAGSFGLGYEFRVGPNFSVTPFFNSLVTSAVDVQFNGDPLPTGEDIKVSLLQLGVGVTWH